MIQSVTVTTKRGYSKTLSLREPYASGFNIKNIEGISPIKANLHMIENAGTFGSKFNGSRVGSRNIVLTLGLVDLAEDIEKVRIDSYRLFPNGQPVQLRFKTDYRTVEILGYVEDNVPDIFDKNVVSRVSIICPSPYFYEVGGDKNYTTYHLPAGVADDDTFTFPFSNESLNTKLISMGGTGLGIQEFVIPENDGDVSAGAIFRITAKKAGPIPDIYSYDEMYGKPSTGLTDFRLRGQNAWQLAVGDVLYVSTLIGNKYVKLNGMEPERENSWVYIGPASYLSPVGPGDALYSSYDPTAFDIHVLMQTYFSGI